MPTLQLANEDARIVALAITYHLGRPGSETDPTTIQRHEFGLGPVGRALASRLAEAHVSLELTPYQLHRLDEALLGITNELKQHELSHGRSAVPGFEAAIASLFPELRRSEANGGDRADDLDRATALDLVTSVVMLRRRLASTIAAAAAAIEAERLAALGAGRATHPWWRFWRW